MVRRASLLGRAMDKRRPDERFPGYGKVLNLLARDDHTEAAWDALVGTVEPGSGVELAVAVLDTVVICYIEVPFALGSADRRAVIETRFAERSAALDVLEGAFRGLPAVRVIEEPMHDRGLRSPSVNESGDHPDFPPALKMALEVWRAQPADPEAPGPSFNHPDARSYNEHLQTARTAPAGLGAMRRYLEREREAEVAATQMHLTSRKRAGGDVGLREFTFALGEALRERVGLPRHEFTTAVATALFPDSANAVTFAATRGVSDRERARRTSRKGG